MPFPSIQFFFQFLVLHLSRRKTRSKWFRKCLWCARHRKKSSSRVFIWSTKNLRNQNDFYWCQIDVRNHTVTTAINKWGRTSDEAKAVCETWYAVGVGGENCFFRGSGGISSTDGNGNPTDDDVSVFCTRGTTKTFILFGVDPTSNVEWATSSNLLKSEETNTSVKVEVTGTNPKGHGYVSATIDETTTFYYDIWVGSPQVEISYSQVSPSRVDVRLVGANGTDVYKLKK